MRRALLAIAIAWAAPARADNAADITTAFNAFVANVTSAKPALDGVELFITPYGGSFPVATPDDLQGMHALLPAPKLSHVTVVVSPSGTSAWLAADVAAQITDDDHKTKPGAMRASAVFAKDRAGWHVRATHWSIANANRAVRGCGNIAPWFGFTPGVPASLGAIAGEIWKAVGEVDGDTGSSSLFLAALSTNPRALAIGSAPGERWAGPAAIKALFTRYRVFRGEGDYDSIGSGSDVWDTAWVRAGQTPDGQLVWMAIPIANDVACTTYRTLFVLDREGGQWKIVHQHYSER